MKSIDEKIADFWRKWNGWGIIVFLFILSLFILPIPFIIDFIVRNVLNIA